MGGFLLLVSVSSLLALVNQVLTVENIQSCRISRYNKVDLSNHNLTKIPSSLPNETEYLDLSYNRISMLSSEDLVLLPNLCILKLNHNSLKHISPKAFQKNSKLQILNISHNSLKIIPDLIVPHLRILDISNNLYKSYALRTSFSNFLQLFSLTLGSSYARSINITDFAPLHTIPLKQLTLGDGLGLQSYESSSFSHLKSLQQITLNMTFCEKTAMFQNILQDLDKIQVQSLRLIKFLPPFCNVSSEQFEGLKKMTHLSNLTFVDTWFNSSVLTNLLLYIFQSPVEVLGFYNVTYNEDTSDGVTFYGIPGYNGTDKLRALIFDYVLHYQYSYPNIHINVSYFSQMTYLKFSGTGMNISPCNLISSLPSLEVLDLSNNLLTDNGFWWSGCSYTNVFPALRKLYLRKNKFSDLAFISEKTHQMKALEELDLSFNSLKLDGQCSWPFHLTTLILSNNDLGDTVFNYLSPHFRSLSLSKTGITTLQPEVLSKFPNLTHLFLSSNTISVLQPHLGAPKLEVLHVDQNDINLVSEQLARRLQRLKQFKAGNNPFICSCDSYWFMTFFNKSLLSGWPSDYYCNSPAEMIGKLLEQYQPSKITCEVWLQVVIAVLVVLIVTGVLSFTFYVCDGAWYLKMLWVWMKVKRRGYREEKRLVKSSFKYHAFISYSQNDYSWVDSQLVPNLENAGFRLCIHERDFVPGDWIIDNIINCVEGSYKTLFVLSQNFVQSEWCNYELFFAQHRALSIQQDSLVFILLEPIPADSLPRKFLKLRALLRKQTYLEWPKEVRKQTFFWASLKGMLQTADAQMVMKQVAREIAESFPLLTDTD
nr:PREDICTED: toll-like receptor 1 [Lepisosteus oculatus]